MHAVSGNVLTCQRKTCLWPGIRPAQIKRRGFWLACRLARSGARDEGNREMVRPGAGFLSRKQRRGGADDGTVKTGKGIFGVIQRQKRRLVEW